MKKRTPWVSMTTFQGTRAVTLGAGDVEATFVPDVGMLGVALRHRGESLLCLDGGVSAYRSGRLTGLPLLAPWANRLSGWQYDIAGAHVDLDGLAVPTDAAGLPMHGTMTAQLGWDVRRLQAERHRAVLETDFDFGARPDLLASFPFPHRLTIEASVDPDGLGMVTTVRPTGDRAVPVSFGYHPFLQLPGACRGSYYLGLPRCEHVLLDDRLLPSGAIREVGPENEPLGARSFDDLFIVETPAELAVVGGGRRLVLDLGNGYDFVQIYSCPGSEFVCLEPMTAPVDALTTGGCRLVSPGATFSAGFRLRVATA